MMKTKSIPPLHETHSLAYWNSGRVLLNISYDTDSVYLFVEGIPTIEFTANSDVRDIRNPDKPRLIGYFKTPKGYGFGEALEFRSTREAKTTTGIPLFSVVYVSRHVEIYLRFEEALCKMLIMDKGPETLAAFLDCNWDTLKQLNPTHQSLTVTFN